MPHFNPIDAAKKTIKLLINFSFALRVQILKLLGLVDFAVPPNTSLRTTSSTSIRKYYESGIRCYLPIAVCAQYNQIDLNSENVNVLDFGCGAGRQILHFTKRYPAPNYYGCDVNDSLFPFLQKNYPEVQFYCNSFEPPLKYESDFFDIAYSVSVFSHLSPQDHPKWLDELARITKKGGLIFLTTEGFTSCPRIQQKRTEDFPDLTTSDLEESGILYQGYKDFDQAKANEKSIKFGSKFIGIDRTYGTTIISPSHIKENWIKHGLDVISVLEGIIDHRQDLVVLKKV
ncbi:MAG: class I SAM-dependent methyltransferase [Cyanobacteria bacterium J06636_16]